MKETLKIKVSDDGSRTWYYDSKGRCHRPENEGPAGIDTEKNMQWYQKRGKNHRVGGPAFYTAIGTEIYYLEGVELSKEMHEWCVKNNKSKPPKTPKIDILILKQIAVKLIDDAITNKKINEFDLNENDVNDLNKAKKESSWSKNKQIDYINNSSGFQFEFSLNCKPFDDTLRCYIYYDVNGNLTNSFLSIE